MVVLGVVIGLLVLVFLVAIHELGHAVAAKRNGVEVEEYGIGFPPRAKKWQPKQSFLGKNVVFSLNWLPLGGFVKLKGEYDSARGKGAYGAAGYWVKTKILLAGVLVNWLAAVVLFAVLAIFGLPKILPHQVMLPFDNTSVKTPVKVVRLTEGSPAAQVGLRVDDEIIAMNEKTISTSAQLSEATQQSSGQTVNIEVKRNNQTLHFRTTLLSRDQAKNGGYLGVVPHQSETIHATWSAPLVGVATTVQLTHETLKGVGSMIVQGIGGFFGQFIGSPEQKQAAKADLAKVGNNVAGPVGILGVLFPSVVNSGLTQVLLLAAIISLTLAVMNILPIPALDGGRWFTMTIFRLLKKPLTKDREETIQATGFLILMALTIVVTWNDIAKLFS
jgi:hypothetical protein